MSDRDYYEIIGLTRGADGAMVDQAYWHLARKYQSLAATNPRARQMLDELNEAYGVIGSPKLREQYDGFRDDVLISKGIIQPVKSSPKRNVQASSDGLPLRLPQLWWDHWRRYAASGVVIALTVASALQGVHPIVVIGAAVTGLVLALTPALRRQPDAAVPALAIPELRIPRAVTHRLARSTPPRTRETGGGLSKDEALGADELHASTAAMILRWRNSVGLRPLPVSEDSADAPSTTLVDIVVTEHDLDDQSEPLSAVIDILRGAYRSADHR